MPLLAELIHDALRLLPAGPALLLDLDQEPLELIDGHDLVLGVLPEEGLDLLRSLRRRGPELPAEAEAHSVRLFRHGSVHATPEKRSLSRQKQSENFQQPCGEREREIAGHWARHDTRMGRDAILGRDKGIGGTSQEPERREGWKIGAEVVVHYGRGEGGGGDESTLPVPERWTGTGLGRGAQWSLSLG